MTMPNKDRDKVIQGLKQCTSASGHCFHCPYSNDGERTADCQTKIDEDALAILNDKRTVLHKQSRKELSSGSTMVTGVYFCPWCHEIISIAYADDDYHFCPYCGRGVKWDG